MTVVTTSNAVAATWKNHARELAQWAFGRAVNRVDAWGVHKVDGSRATGKGVLDLQRLAAHFAGDRVIGIHLISLENTCKSVKIDIDAHPDGDTSELAAKNLTIALGICDRARAIGLTPLLTDSNGKGGYHLEIILSAAIPSQDANHFGLWLARGFNPNKKDGIEVFPKRSDRETEKGFGGGWVRLYGKHHKRDHWTKVYDFERAAAGFNPWFEGEEAIAAILRHCGDDPTLVLAHREEYSRRPAPRQAPMPSSAPLGQRPFNAVERARAYLATMEPPDPRPENSMDASTQLLKGASVAIGFALSDEEAVTLLRDWDMANPCRPYPLSEYRRKLREAATNKPRGWILARDNNACTIRAMAGAPCGATRPLDEYRQEMMQARLDSVSHPDTINFDSSPPGAGKSTADISAAKAAGSSLTIVPSHSNCQEVERTYHEAGLPAVAYPPLDESTCRNLREATRALAAGLSPSSCVCPTCPYSAGCHYRERMNDAESAESSNRHSSSDGVVFQRDSEWPKIRRDSRRSREHVSARLQNVDPAWRPSPRSPNMRRSEPLAAAMPLRISFPPKMEKSANSLRGSHRNRP